MNLFISQARKGMFSCVFLFWVCEDLTTPMQRFMSFNSLCWHLWADLNHNLYFWLARSDSLSVWVSSFIFIANLFDLFPLIRSMFTFATPSIFHRATLQTATHTHTHTHTHASVSSSLADSVEFSDSHYLSLFSFAFDRSSRLHLASAHS